ncbi:hypothetical protein BDZ89DRAFT_1060938 [Hymenopellis radicata]|nr:hypothetical protein BDZ89DRAFT_1079674 [Hymenopellis radicata]KAF9039483.1 hypothetical protein BDZ89DRAFT_1060938 [Hymenopellis radicata]
MQSTRPTLPSLRSLDLLPTTSTYESQTHSRPAPNYGYTKQRQFSISSSTSSRTPSPPPQQASDKVSLLPCPMEDANAVVFVPPSIPGQPRPEALLLVGPAMQAFRNPQRPLAKGARVHPYRMVRAPSSRKSSSA